MGGSSDAAAAIRLSLRTQGTRNDQKLPGGTGISCGLGPALHSFVTDGRRMIASLELMKNEAVYWALRAYECALKLIGDASEISANYKRDKR